jgi:hypothetical protein
MANIGLYIYTVYIIVLIHKQFRNLSSLFYNKPSEMLLFSLALYKFPVLYQFVFCIFISTLSMNWSCWNHTLWYDILGFKAEKMWNVVFWFYSKLR